MSTKELMPLLGRLAPIRILVVGDLILDHYLRGTSDRVSPEAPVPVVLLRQEENIPGGAANVARNVRAAGAAAACVGAVGPDADGAALRASLDALGVDCSGLVEVAGRPTTRKTRVISHNQQMIRLDREDASPLPAAACEAILAAASRLMDSCDAVILSDYAKGVLTPGVIAALIAGASGRNLPLFVDPKGRDYARYRGAHALTPNAREAADASGHPTADLAGLALAAAAIRETTACGLLLITRGADGVAIFGPRDTEPMLIPAAAREVFDVTGAGDTFIAWMAMAAAAGAAPAEAAALANAAAGVVVGKSGAATVAPWELRTALAPDSVARKLRAPEEMAELGRQLRGQGRRIVFTNGCFDFLHSGHVAFLQEARSLGDVLVLATNSDAVITRLKGAPRPVLPEDQRVRLLAAIEAIDYIVVFPDDTPHVLLEALRPDVLVKGSNYTPDQVEGHELVESCGGRVERLDIVGGFSTGEMIGRTRTNTD